MKVHGGNMPVYFARPEKAKNPPIMARNGPTAMFAVRSLSGAKRTSSGSAKIDANDPKQA